MKSLKVFFTTISSFSLIGAGGYGIYLLMDKFLNMLSGVKNDIATAIIIAVIAGFFSVASLVITKLYEANKERENLLREKKTDVYENVIKFFLEILRSSGDPISQESVKSFMYEEGRKMFTWGSDPVVQIFCDIRKESVAITNENEAESGLRLLKKYEELIFEIRKDLGYKNKKLKKGDILALYINDVDKIIK